MAVTLWNMWKARNQAVFRRRKPEVSAIIDSTQALLKSYQRWTQRKGGSRDRGVTEFAQGEPSTAIKESNAKLKQGKTQMQEQRVNAGLRIRVFELRDNMRPNLGGEMSSCRREVLSTGGEDSRTRGKEKQSWPSASNAQLSSETESETEQVSTGTQSGEPRVAEERDRFLPRSGTRRAACWRTHEVGGSVGETETSKSEPNQRRPRGTADPEGTYVRGTESGVQG